MYNRAIKKLKTILHSKGIKDSGQSMEKSEYGLLHFHIEAAENQIKLNKFDTKKESPPSLIKSKKAHANLG